VNNLDINGDSITYVYNGENYYYQKINGQYGFYNSNGYLLDNRLSNALASALILISEGESGKGMLDYLVSCSSNVRVSVGSGDNEAILKKNGVIVNWNPDSYEGGVDEYGKNMDTLPFVNLAHELYHAEDFIKNGTVNNSVWYYSPNGITRKSELEACLFENRIRAEHGLPFRKYYANYDKTGRGYGPSMIPIFTINPINIWKQRANIYKTLYKR
jgi:hypothetical protein